MKIILIILFIVKNEKLPVFAEENSQRMDHDQGG